MPFSETLRLLIEILIIAALTCLMWDMPLKQRMVQAEAAVRALVMSKDEMPSKELTIATPMHPEETEPTAAGRATSTATPILVAKPAIRSTPGPGVHLQNTYSGPHDLNQPAAAPTVTP